MAECLWLRMTNMTRMYAKAGITVSPRGYRARIINYSVCMHVADCAGALEV